jgi:F0F1-type ATP synthase membrane subunit c/vacuolar-type H+-ATPase subunit K
VDLTPLAAGLAMGLGAIGPGIGLGIALAEAIGIYALVVSLLLIFVQP